MFSRLVARTGTQARSRSHGKPTPRSPETVFPWGRQKLEVTRGSARVYSELLVEENKKCWGSK